MRTYDIGPLWRSTVGFDRLFDLVDAARHAAGDDNYPPCNVERLSSDRYRISLALEGFSPDEIAITAEQKCSPLKVAKPTMDNGISSIGKSLRGPSSGTSI